MRSFVLCMAHFYSRYLTSAVRCSGHRPGRRSACRHPAEARTRRECARCGVRAARPYSQIGGYFAPPVRRVSSGQPTRTSRMAGRCSMGTPVCGPLNTALVCAYRWGIDCLHAAERGHPLRGGSIRTPRHRSRDVAARRRPTRPRSRDRRRDPLPSRPQLREAVVRLARLAAWKVRPSKRPAPWRARTRRLSLASRGGPGSVALPEWVACMASTSQTPGDSLGSIRPTETSVSDWP